jgi:hypothetical protein
LTTRETVFWDTPASRATSTITAPRDCPLGDADPAVVMAPLTT